MKIIAYRPDRLPRYLPRVIRNEIQLLRLLRERLVLRYSRRTKDADIFVILDPERLIPERQGFGQLMRIFGDFTVTWFHDDAAPFSAWVFVTERYNTVGLGRTTDSRGLGYGAVAISTPQRKHLRLYVTQEFCDIDEIIADAADLAYLDEDSRETMHICGVVGPDKMPYSIPVTNPVRIAA